MRTIAAITMIMAVVVAAIPVENYGSMQAAEDGNTESFNMQVIYDADVDDGYFSDSSCTPQYSGYNDNDKKMIQQIQNGSVKKAYEVEPDSAKTKAIVSGIGELSDITIHDTEYYDYVMFDPDYIDAIKRFIGDDITVTFDNDLAQSAISSRSKEVYVDNATTSVPLPNFDELHYLQTEPTGTTIPLSEITNNENSQGYNKVKSGVALEYDDLIINCEPEALENQKELVEDFNADLKNVADAIQRITDFEAQSPNPTVDHAIITQEQYDSWKKLTDSSFSLSSINTLTISHENLSKNGNLPKAVEYIICQCYGNDSQGLEKFELIESDYNNSVVYLAKKKDSENVGDAYKIDGDGYLATKSINVVGIKTEAFKENNIVQNITLSPSVEFIGINAFKGCQTLQTVTINYDAVSGGCSQIGDEAFAGSTLSSIVFSDTGATSKLTEIGKRAFRNTKLTSIEIPATVTQIGAGCFENINSLSDVTFKSGGNNGVTVGAYAFYNCPSIGSVAFEDALRQYKLGKGTFALPTETKNVMMDFSFPSGNTNINYGDANDIDKYDYILAGRSSLEKVTFGEKLSDTIPDNTLRGCYNLREAHFKSATAKYNTYKNNAIYEPQLFSNVTQPFMVFGPQKKADNTTDADPLVSSWTGHLGYKIDGEWAPVPYQYMDADNKTHIELGYKSGQYIATVDVIEGSSDAILSKYKLNTSIKVSETRTPVTIPRIIGNYNIVEIGNNCFADNVKSKIYKITIEDGHVVSVGDSAFSGCSNLEWVYLGNSITYIGSKAFADCPALENIVFSHTGKVNYKATGIDYVIGDDDETWANELSIPNSDAFATKSKRLTFHGAIHSGYRPFEIAMSENNSDLLDSSAQICYKTDEPLNLTVIRNRADGKATLVDYPHYQEIDDINREYIRQQHEAVGDSYSIIREFEDKCVNSDTGMDREDEKAIVEAALNIELPRGIQSIATHRVEKDGNGTKTTGFYDGTLNLDDYEYVKYHYVLHKDNVEATSGFDSKRIYQYEPISSSIRSVSGDKQDITKLYSENGYIADSSFVAEYGEKEGFKVALGGLFSGYFNDNNKEVSSAMVEQYALNENSTSSGLIDNTYNNHKYVENYNSGNDYLTTVDMATVESLPDYAFDSCENLLVAQFSDSLSKIGALPFRNCKSLYHVGLGGNNQNYVFENMMLFEGNGDGQTYTVVECLEGRGQGNEYLSANIDAGEFSEAVTAIAEGAFSNCNEVKVVDLSGSAVTEIPVDCFKNDKSLNSVKLPNTIRQVNTGAFVGVADAITITVPTSDCVITAGAIDGKSDVTIIGSKYKTDGETLSDLWHSYQTLVKDYGEENVHFTDYGNSYTIEFVDKDLNTIQGYLYVVTVEEKDKPYNLSQQQIPLSAPEVNGYDFVTWMCKVNGEVLTGTKAGDKAFNNISEDRMYYPSYTANPKKVVSDGSYKFEFENATATVVSGSDTIAAGTQLKSGEQIEGGATISLIADNQSKFQYWSAEPTTAGDTNNYNDMFSGSTKNYIITFTMPNADVKVTAHLNTSGSGSGGESGGGESGGGTGGGESGGGTGGGSTTDTTKKYKVTVNYGTGSGEYKAGDTVNISALAPDTSSKVFSKWTSATSGVGFASATSSTTSFIMPASDVTVTANYKTRSNDDDEDSDRGSSSSGRPGSGSTTNTVTNRPSSSTSTTGTTGTVTNTTNGNTTGNNNSNNNNGNKLYITKNGVSNKDVGSVSVDGSTDNFIVKISDSDEATAAVKEALTNKYGSLDGLAYFPMDISLYDSTGQNKITDTYGLNITVTMPIPDVLIQYGGNARVAAADNGNLQQLTPKFTTIDGIACISFVPPHFSPYVIYVDTNNLVAGQTLDSTPSTGDPIHPKWFAAIGMACISVILFATSDGHKRRKYRAA